MFTDRWPWAHGLRTILEKKLRHCCDGRLRFRPDGLLCISLNFSSGNFTLLYRRLLKRAKIDISHLAGKDLRWCLCLNASAAVKAAGLAGKTMFVAFCFIVFYQATFYSQFGFGIWLRCQLVTPASENVFQASIDSWNNFDRVWPWQMLIRNKTTVKKFNSENVPKRQFFLKKTIYQNRNILYSYCA